jgi:hypothetical protein
MEFIALVGGRKESRIRGQRKELKHGKKKSKLLAVGSYQQILIYEIYSKKETENLRGKPTDPPNHNRYFIRRRVVMA